MLCVRHNEIALFHSHAHHRKRATLPLAKCLEHFKRLGRDGQHITLLALVAPDLFGREARLFQRHGAQVKLRAPARVIGEFRKSVAQAASPHVMNGEDRVVGLQCPAMVDDLLRAPLDLWVAALNRIKIKLRRIGPRGHGAGRAAAHANAHAGAAELDQQTARGKDDFLGGTGVNHAQAAGDHDGLVVTALFGDFTRCGCVRYRLLVFAEVPQQIGPTEFIVEGSAAQRAFDHDLQRAGDVLGFAIGINWNLTPINFGHSETRQPGFGFGTAACGAFVANFSARAGGRARERRDSRGVVVGLHLHQNVVCLAIFVIASYACFA